MMTVWKGHKSMAQMACWELGSSKILKCCDPDQCFSTYFLGCGWKHNEKMLDYWSCEGVGQQNRHTFYSQAMRAKQEPHRARTSVFQSSIPEWWHSCTVPRQRDHRLGKADLSPRQSQQRPCHPKPWSESRSQRGLAGPGRQSGEFQDHSN